MVPMRVYSMADASLDATPFTHSEAMVMSIASTARVSEQTRTGTFSFVNAYPPAEPRAARASPVGRAA